VLDVPNQSLHTSGSQRTVTVLFEGTERQVPVTVGLAGDSFTEITGTTLREGDEVVISSSSTTTSSSTTRNSGNSSNGPEGFGGPGMFGP